MIATTSEIRNVDIAVLVKTRDSTHLEFILLTAEVGSLLLPEVVGLDDVRRVDAVAEVVLQHLEDRLHRGPARVAPHVDDHGEPQVPDILAEKMKI